MTRIAKNKELLKIIKGSEDLVLVVTPISTRRKLEMIKRGRKFPENLGPCVECPSGARIVHGNDNEVVGLHCGDMSMKKDEHISVCEVPSQCPRQERWVTAHHTTKHHRKPKG